MYEKKFIEDKSVDDKLLLVMAFIRLNCSQHGVVRLSINEIIDEIGYLPNGHKGRINDNIKQCLLWLETQNHIFIHSSLQKLRNTDCFKISINNDYNIFDMSLGSNDSNKTNPFVCLTYDEYIIITQCKSKVDKARLLRIFLNIKKRISTDDLQAKYCYPSINTIARDCKVTRGTNICQAIKDLESAGILFTYCAGSYPDKNGDVKNSKNVNTCYAIKPDQFNGAYEEALSYVRNTLGIDIEKLNPKIENSHTQKKKVAIKTKSHWVSEPSWQDCINDDEVFRQILENANDECNDLY